MIKLFTLMKLITIICIFLPECQRFRRYPKSATFSSEEVYCRSKFLGDNHTVKHAHMRDCIAKIVVKVSFEGARRLFSATAVLLLSNFLGGFWQWSVKGNEHFAWKTAMRRNGDIVSKCGQGRYFRKEYISMMLLSVRLSAFLTALVGWTSFVGKLSGWKNWILQTS